LAFENVVVDINEPVHTIGNTLLIAAGQLRTRLIYAEFPALVSQRMHLILKIITIVNKVRK